MPAVNMFNMLVSFCFVQKLSYFYHHHSQIMITIYLKIFFVMIIMIINSGCLLAMQ